MQWASALISTEQPARRPFRMRSVHTGEQFGGHGGRSCRGFRILRIRFRLRQPPRTRGRTAGPPGVWCWVVPAAGIIGGGSEVEQEPAVSLTAASLPGVNIHPIRLESDSLPSLDAPPDEWHTALGVDPADQPQFVLLADPMSFPAQNLLLGMDYAYPAAAKIGGLASAAQGARQNGSVPGARLPRLGSGRRGAVGQHRSRNRGRPGMPAHRRADAHHPQRPQLPGRTGRAAAA